MSYTRGTRRIIANFRPMSIPFFIFYIRLAKCLRSFTKNPWNSGKNRLQVLGVPPA